MTLFIQINHFILQPFLFRNILMLKYVIRIDMMIRSILSKVFITFIELLLISIYYSIDKNYYSNFILSIIILFQYINVFATTYVQYIQCISYKKTEKIAILSTIVCMSISESLSLIKKISRS